MVFEELGLEPFDSTTTDDIYPALTSLRREENEVLDGTTLNSLDKRLSTIVRLLDR